MNLYGGLVRNLESAIESAERLRGQQVHGETLRFWRNLIAYARDENREHPAPRVDELIEQLQSELPASADPVENTRA